MAGDRESAHRSVRWLLAALLGLGLVWAAPGADAAARQSAPAGMSTGSAHAVLVASLQLTARSAPASVHADDGRSVDAAPAGTLTAARLVAVTAGRTYLSDASRSSVHVTGSRAPPVEGIH